MPAKLAGEGENPVTMPTHPRCSPSSPLDHRRAVGNALPRMLRPPVCLRQTPPPKGEKKAHLSR
ncbi:MAG: hypothetical protein PVF83_05865 [Anaerolineales bacterium]